MLYKRIYSLMLISSFLLLYKRIYSLMLIISFSFKDESPHYVGAGVACSTWKMHLADGKAMSAAFEFLDAEVHK